MISFRVAALVLVALAGSSFSFLDSFYGLLSAGFFSYVDENVFTHGAYPLAQLGYSVTAVFLVTTLLQKRTLFAPHPLNLLVALFWALCLASGALAGIDWSARDAGGFSLTVVTALAMTAVLGGDAKLFRRYVWFMVLVIGGIAAQSGIRGTLAEETGDGTYGFHGILSDDRNSTGIYLCMILPFVFYLIKAEKNRRAKALLALILVGDLLALVLTYSRGAFIGLTATAIFMMGFARNRVPKMIIAAALVSVAVWMYAPREQQAKIAESVPLRAVARGPLPVVPEAYQRRISSIEDWHLDRSASTRVMIWKSSLGMILNRPFGVGFKKFEDEIGAYPDPKTGKTNPGMAAHNTLLHVWAELGLAGVALYAMIFLQTFLAMGRVRRLAETGACDRRYSEYARMIQAALVGFFAAGFFNSEPYSPLPWHVVALGVALDRLAAEKRRPAAHQARRKAS